MVFVDGKSLGELAPREMKRAHALFEEMKVRHLNSNIPIKSRAYTLSVSGSLDVAQLKSVIETAAFAGWPLAVLETSAGRVSLQAVVPSPPDSTRKLEWPEQVLVLVVHAKTVEVWRVPRDGSTKTSGSVTQLLNANAALAARLGEECGSARCSPAVLLAANDASFERVEKALGELSKASKATPLEVELRVAEPQAAGTPPQLRVGSTSMGGRLPPELIQKVVRDAYGRLRRCYEVGLAKNANLEGKVVVRFLITREGKVGDVAVAQGTTLSDKAAIECMVKEYKSLAFPPPEGGIVTVVYPIMFSPE